MLRILALGDAHFQNSNITEVNTYLRKLKIFLDENKDNIDIIVNLGDTLNDFSRIHLAPLNKAMEYTKLLSSYKPTYVIIGNHCAINNHIFLTTDHWANCLKEWQGVKVIDDVVVEIINGCKIVFCPYVQDGKFLTALNTKQGEWEDANCIFSHVTIKGVQMGSVVARDADEWDLSWPMLVSGHIHNAQWLASNMYYTGSILQVAMDENPTKTIAMITVKDGMIPKIEEIDLCLPKKKILHLDMSEIDEFKLNHEINTKYALYLTGSNEEFKAFRKSLKYKELLKDPFILKNGIKFKCRSKETVAVVNENMVSFQDILYDLIMKEEDKLTLIDMYDNIILSKQEPEIIFI